MLDFATCEQLVSTARDKRSKPVDNNTRVEKRDADTYALRLHATDIATFHRDGRVTLNSGGWRTVTTTARLREYVTWRLRSERGVWYVDAEPDPNDPEPARGERTVLKPFHALDPGPEPQKPAEGCLAGTETRTTERKKVMIRRGEEEREGDEHVAADDGGIGDGRTYYYVMRDVTTVTRFTDQRHNYDHTPGSTYEQCPHCKLFDAQHDAWQEAMTGGGWGRNRTHGYRAMVAALERYGSREAWQEAYIADFRAAREQRKLHREWVDRNRVLFEDGMEITAEGYARRPDPKAIARTERKLKRIEKKRARIDKFVKDAVNELVTNGLPMPSGGDCWYCAFIHAPQESERQPGAISMGDSMPTLQSDGTVSNQPSHEHLLAHIRERYYVPSMFSNALLEAGYRPVGVYINLGMNQDAERMGGPGERVSVDTVTRGLRRYLYKRLIPEAFGANKVPPLVGNTR